MSFLFFGGGGMYRGSSPLCSAILGSKGGSKEGKGGGSALAQIGAAAGAAAGVAAGAQIGDSAPLWFRAKRTGYPTTSRVSE